MVRFDSAGQAWCDRLECWDCYRLTKIGEALYYRCLLEWGGKRLIEQGMEAWATYARTQRTFLVKWAIKEALRLYRIQGIEEPDPTGEMNKQVKIPPLVITGAN